MTEVTNIELSDLMPCPFCGEDKEMSLMEHKDCYFIRCECCNTTGPDGNDPESCVLQWNQREGQGEVLN